MADITSVVISYVIVVVVDVCVVVVVLRAAAIAIIGCTVLFWFFSLPACDSFL